MIHTRFGSYLNETQPFRPPPAIRPTGGPNFRIGTQIMRHYNSVVDKPIIQPPLNETTLPTGAQLNLNTKVGTNTTVGLPPSKTSFEPKLEL